MINVEVGKQLINKEKLWPHVTEYSLNESHNFIVFDCWADKDVTLAIFNKLGFKVSNGVLYFALELGDDIYILSYTAYKDSEQCKSEYFPKEVRVSLVDSNTGIVVAKKITTLSKYFAEKLNLALETQLVEQESLGAGKVVANSVSQTYPSADDIFRSGMITMRALVSPTHLTRSALSTH